MNYFNYFSEIEETFNRRRGKYLFLSPLDWALIESWQEKGVPLHIVLGGIEKVFDGYDAKPNRRTVKSLTYCREEIEAQYDEWLERQIGKTSAEENSQPNAETSAGETNLFANDAVREHLRRVYSELNEAAQAANKDLRETLETVSAKILELEKNYADAETLESSLSDLEKMIDERLIAAAEKTELGRIKAQAEKNLAAYRGKMDGEVFERTFDLMVLKSLRENARIPRLSLFYL